MNEFERLTNELKAETLPLIVYGAGNSATYAELYLEKHNIEFEGYAVDSEYMPEKREYLGKPLFALEDYLKHGKYNILSSVSKLSNERIEQLNRKENINKVYLIDYMGTFFPDKQLTDSDKQQLSLLREELCDEISKQHFDAFIRQKITLSYGKPFSMNVQHFDNDILHFSENEIYADCGAFDGTSVIDFINALKRSNVSSYKKIYAFECDPDNLIKLKTNISDLDNVDIIPKGLYDKTGTVRFNNTGNEHATIGEGNIDIEVTTLDEFIGDGCCTFIKAYFESSSKCIMGAANVIKRCRPKLAIGCNHIDEHLITIPRFVKELVPDYNFYFRNYSSFSGGGVLYAV
ncbi:MAG: hypothetical protein K2N56_11165 [Oscillospiraceae bacterium]|nr:hypothetical protein [Oscillospiraceae bacterium]